jgi:hypothetical protein
MTVSEEVAAADERVASRVRGFAEAERHYAELRRLRVEHERYPGMWLDRDARDLELLADWEARGCRLE